ncbi:hypothetical protein EYF80_017672 [Liparis tanakae]|uniref:Uncharacterized protein n=1 Tax=Liparis tanakae TaxID=230148 RepID=A0A4Z2I3Q2_9TELE|nr:hypothetical protein EYF80_017672 [Liparis tanakae]
MLASRVLITAGTPDSMYLEDRHEKWLLGDNGLDAVAHGELVHDVLLHLAIVNLPRVVALRRRDRHGAAALHGPDLDDALAQEVVRLSLQTLLHSGLDVVVLVPDAQLDAVRRIVALAVETGVGVGEPSNNGSLRHYFRFHKEPFKLEFFKGPLPKEFFKEPIPSGHAVPLMVILADHLEVPSRTLCFTAFMSWTWIALAMANTLRISSKISGLFLSRIFIRSFMAMMMCCVRSSAPVLELFSAAPEGKQRKKGG